MRTIDPFVKVSDFFLAKLVNAFNFDENGRP